MSSHSATGFRAPARSKAESRSSGIYLLATGDGDLYLFKRSKDVNKLELHQLKQRVPINTLEFTTAMAGVPVALNWFRVADVSTQVTAQGVRVFASHHYWKRDERCFVLRVSALSGSVEEIATESRKLAWGLFTKLRRAYQSSYNEGAAVRWS
jgi:hypothetical protein